MFPNSSILIKNLFFSLTISFDLDNLNMGHLFESFLLMLNKLILLSNLLFQVHISNMPIIILLHETTVFFVAPLWLY